MMPGRARGLTVTLKLWVALRLGVPLSATTTVTGLRVLAWVTKGRQEKTPLLVFSAALAGPVARLKVSVCGGTSVSVAVFVMTRFTPTLMVRLETAASAGLVFWGVSTWMA